MIPMTHRPKKTPREYVDQRFDLCDSLIICSIIEPMIMAEDAKIMDLAHKVAASAIRQQELGKEE